MLIFEKNNKLYISFNNKVDEPNLEFDEEGVHVLEKDIEGLPPAPAFGDGKWCGGAS